MRPMAELPLPVVAFSHVGISVTDFERAIDFYTRVLGFRVVADPRAGGHPRVLLAVDDVTLELLTPGAGPEVMVPEPTTFPKPKLALTVPDAAAARATAVEQGVELWGDELYDTPVSLVFWIRDPDGTAIQLHQFKDEGARRVADLFE
jgi:catechol 2,3-dioxygenase-like lactoylglutathione lyase family enzyme